METKVTCCILAKNEEKNIVQCIKSAKKITNDIVVIDNGSTDKTYLLSVLHGAKVYTYTEGNEPFLRNLFFEFAQGEWIFSLDADERIDDRLALEIKKTLLTDCFMGYRVPINNYFGGLRWSTNLACRLFRNLSMFRYDHFEVHTSVGGSIFEMGGNIGVLESPLHHLDGLDYNRNSEKRVNYLNSLLQYLGSAGNTRVLNYLAVEYISQKKFEEAREVLGKVIRSGKRDSFLANYYLGESYLFDEKYKEATLVFQNIIDTDETKVLENLSIDKKFLIDAKIISDDLKQRSFSKLAEIFYRKGEISESIKLINNAIEIYPRSSQHYLSKAGILYGNRRKSTDFIECMIKAFKYNTYIPNLIRLNATENENTQYYFQSSVLSSVPRLTEGFIIDNEVTKHEFSKL